MYPHTATRPRSLSGILQLRNAIEHQHCLCSCQATNAHDYYISVTVGLECLDNTWGGRSFTICLCVTSRASSSSIWEYEAKQSHESWYISDEDRIILASHQLPSFKAIVCDLRGQRPTGALYLAIFWPPLHKLSSSQQLTRTLLLPTSTVSL